MHRSLLERHLPPGVWGVMKVLHQRQPGDGFKQTETGLITPCSQVSLWKNDTLRNETRIKLPPAPKPISNKQGAISRHFFINTRVWECNFPVLMRGVTADWASLWLVSFFSSLSLVWCVSFPSGMCGMDDKQQRRGIPHWETARRLLSFCLSVWCVSTRVFSEGDPELKH